MLFLLVLAFMISPICVGPKKATVNLALYSAVLNALVQM